MTKLEVNIPQRLHKKLEQHADDPTAIEPLIRRAIEQYIARLDKIDADAGFAKAHGHYPERRFEDARYPDALFPVWRYHPFVTNSELPTADVDGVVIATFDKPERHLHEVPSTEDLDAVSASGFTPTEDEDDGA